MANSAGGTNTYGKDHLTTSHGDSLLDQSFQSLKSKEVRDSMSPPHELPFHSLSLNQADASGWDIQTCTEISPDGRAYRSETLAKTDGIEKINGGGIAEFQGSNEQCSKASHDGDDRNYVKKASESSKTHLQEVLVFGDDNSERTEMKKTSSKTSRSTSKVISSSSSTVYQEGGGGGVGSDTMFDDHRAMEMTREERTNTRQQQQQQQQHDHHKDEQHYEQYEETQSEKYHQRSEHETNTSSTMEMDKIYEESKKYVDMDKTSPEYQQHVQFLMAQPGEILSNTVEYPHDKPHVKMITTVKRLPDGTIVRNKRYETEELHSAVDSGRQHHSQHHREDQQRVQDEEQHYSQQQKSSDTETRRRTLTSGVPPQSRADTAAHQTDAFRRPSKNVAEEKTSSSTDDVTQISKISSVKKSTQNYSTHVTTETVQGVDHSLSRRRHESKDFTTHGFPSVRADKPTQEYPTARPHTMRDDYRSSNVKVTTTGADAAVKNPSASNVAPTASTDVDVVVLSETELKTNREQHIVESEIVTDYPEYSPSGRADYVKGSKRAARASAEAPRSPKPALAKETSSVEDDSGRRAPGETPGGRRPHSAKDDFSTNGYPSVGVAPRQLSDVATKSRGETLSPSPPPLSSPSASSSSVQQKSMTTSTSVRQSSVSECVRKEKEVDAAHRAFAASLRSSSPIDSVRRDSYSEHQRATARSSVASNRSSSRREGREGSHESTASCDASRGSRPTPMKGATKPPSASAPASSSVKTKNETTAAINAPSVSRLSKASSPSPSPSPTPSASPSPSPTAATSALRKTGGDGPRPESRLSAPAASKPPINEPLTVKKTSQYTIGATTTTPSDNVRAEDATNIEPPCIQRHYYRVSPSVNTASATIAEIPLATITTTFASSSSCSSRPRSHLRHSTPIRDAHDEQFNKEQRPDTDHGAHFDNDTTKSFANQCNLEINDETINNDDDQPPESTEVHLAESFHDNDTQDAPKEATKVYKMLVTKHLKGPTRNDTTAKMTAREWSPDCKRPLKECNYDGDSPDDRQRTVEYLLDDVHAVDNHSIEREPMSKCKKESSEELRNVLLRPANEPSPVRERTSFDYQKEFTAEFGDNKEASPESLGLSNYQKKSPGEIGDKGTPIKESSPKRILEASYQRNTTGERIDGVGPSKNALQEPIATITTTTTTTTTTTPTFKKKGLTRRETFEERCRQILGMEDYGDTQGSYTHDKGSGVEHEFTIRKENLSDNDMDRPEEATKHNKAQPRCQASADRMTTTKPYEQCVDRSKENEETSSFEDTPTTEDLKQINDATLYNTEIVIQQVHGHTKNTPLRLPAAVAQKPFNSSVSDVSRTSSPERKPAPAKTSSPKKRDIVAAVHLRDGGVRKALRPATEDLSLSTSPRKPIKDHVGPRVIQTRSLTKARGETRISKTLATNAGGPRRESNHRPMPLDGNRPRRFSKEKVPLCAPASGREKPSGEGARRPASSPDGSPPPSLERRRSSNISVHTEIVIDHTRPRTPKDEGCRPGAETDDDYMVGALLERQHKKLSVIERKESAPVRRVTREDRDAKMTRSTSENTLRGATRTPKAATPAAGCLSPSGRRPSKCLTTKSINLTAVDRVMRSDDMESVVIDIQRAKSSREPSPNKIVPTPVSDDVDVGRPRYPDVIQEPDDELRRRPVVTNVPIFEEDTNERIGCHIVEINTKDFTQDGDRRDYIADMPSSPTVDAPKSLHDETLDDVCLLSVQDKVSKFTHTIEKQKPAGRPSVDAVVRRSPHVSRNSGTEKISTATNDVFGATFHVDENVARRDHCDHDDSPDTRRPSTTTTTTTKRPEKLAATAPQKSPELVAKIERQISRQNEPASSHRGVKVPDSPKAVHEFAPNYDDADELIPFSKTHATSMELRRQRDVLARPSVFGNKRLQRPDAKDEDFIRKETEMNIKTAASVFKTEVSDVRVHPDDDRPNVNDDDDRLNHITETACETVDTTTNEFLGTVVHQKRPHIEDRDAQHADVNSEDMVQGHGSVAVNDNVRLASVTPGKPSDSAPRHAPSNPGAKAKVVDASTVGPPLHSSHRSSKSVTTKTTEHVVVHPSCSSPCSQETELILDGATKTNAPKGGAPRRESLTKTVAARRNLFERGRGRSPPSSNNANPSTHGSDSISSVLTRRPSYMEHTKSSLEHTRRDSLEINKSSYARRTMPDDENIGVERKPNATVKFDIPQQQQQQQQHRSVENRSRDNIEIETIFDLGHLEELLETVTAYELRRRIRAQIRLVKKNKQNVDTSSRPPRERSISPSPIASSTRSRELEICEVATDRTEMREKASINIEDLPDTHDVVPSDVDDDVAGSQGNEKVRVTTKSVTKTSQHLSKVSNKKHNNNTVQPKENKAPIWADRKNILRKPSMKAPPPGKTFTGNASTKTTFAASERRRQESDSIISSYGIGPTDENGLPLFGIKALRKKSQPPRPSEAKEEFTEHVVEERRYYSDGQTKPMVERKETIVSSNGGIVKRIETKSKGRASPEKNLLMAHKSYLKSGAELKEATQQHDLSVPSSTSKSSKYTRCGSVKEMSEKFIRKESSKILAEKPCGTYPKAGLILRANSRSGIMDKNGQETTAGGRAPLHATSSDEDNDDGDEEGEEEEEEEVDVNEEEEYSYEVLHTVDNTDIGENVIVKRGQRQGGQKLSTRSFLNSSNESRMVTDIDDALERMRNADNVVEVGDSAEDHEARALLNKFIGASAIMSGVEAMMPTKQTKSHRTVEMSSVNSNKQVKSARVTQTLKTGGSSSPVAPRICDLEEIWDEETLKKLLEQAKNYEERRKIRAHLRQLMAEREAHVTSTKSNATDGNDTDVVMTTTKVTTRTVSQTSSVPAPESVPVPVSPFTKFKQLDRQTSQHSPKSSSTSATCGASTSGCAPIFKFTDPALNARATTVKEQLLQWCQIKTKEYENVQVSNFSTSWSDGLAFCALIHHFLPDAFDYSQLTPQSRKHNFELAFSVADEKAGIAPLLDVEDMVAMKRPDWKCVFVYVQSIYRRFRNCQ